METRFTSMYESEFEESVKSFLTALENKDKDLIKLMLSETFFVNWLQGKPTTLNGMNGSKKILTIQPHEVRKLFNAMIASNDCSLLTTFLGWHPKILNSSTISQSITPLDAIITSKKRGPSKEIETNKTSVKKRKTLQRTEAIKIVLNSLPDNKNLSNEDRFTITNNAAEALDVLCKDPYKGLRRVNNINPLLFKITDAGKYKQYRKSLARELNKSVSNFWQANETTATAPIIPASPLRDALATSIDVNILETQTVATTDQQVNPSVANPFYDPQLFALNNLSETETLFNLDEVNLDLDDFGSSLFKFN